MSKVIQWCSIHPKTLKFSHTLGDYTEEGAKRTWGRKWLRDHMGDLMIDYSHHELLMNIENIPSKSINGMEDSYFMRYFNK